MTRLSLHLLAATAAASLIAAPVAAQHQGHMPGMPGMKMPEPKKKPAAKKPAAKKPVAKKAVTKKAVVKKAPAKKAATKKPAAKVESTAPAKPDPHAGHDTSTTPDMEMPGHDMSTMPPEPTTPTADPHAGHDMSSMPGMEMPVHDMGTMEEVTPAGTDLPAGNAPPPPVPTDRAADAVYGPGSMHMGRHHLDQFHGGQKFVQVMFNIAEAQFRKGRDGFEWDGEGWYGGDINRVWIKSEGEGEFGRSVEKAEVQALYSRAIDPYFNIQGGIRYDLKPNPSRVYLTAGVEGLAPSFFELEGFLFLSNKGELLARAEGYYDQRITQRLILQPRAEFNFAAQSTRATLTGAGLSDAEIGLRLRYDIRREFAPYVGVQYQRAFGDTRRFLRDAGEDPSSWSLLTGIRLWF